MVIASDDPAVLGVLSSRPHIAWFRANCARIGAYEGDAVYVKSACFDAFPFPEMDAPARAEIGALAEELEEARDRALRSDPDMTMTMLYNLMMQGGDSQDPSWSRRRDSACVGLLRHLQDRLNDRVEAAYGWTDQPAPDVLVGRLRELNTVRALEETSGLVRYLRPSYQARHVTSVPAQQIEAVFAAPADLPDLPRKGAPLAAAILSSLRGAGRPLSSRALLGRFSRHAGRQAEARVAETLSILAVAGSVQRTDGGWFAPR